MSEQEPANAVRRRATAIRLTGASPERELATVASLARRPGCSALVITELSGDAAALGRFQPPGTSLASREVRRISGGRSTRYGDGLVSLCALAPSAQSWLDEKAALSGPRLLNRLVRGLLAGLGRLGLAASYPGRDFVIANGRRIAYVSLARETSGVVLFQAVIAIGAPYTTREREPSWPGLPPSPSPTWLARERTSAPEFDAVATALADGFSERFALVFDLEPEPATDALPPPVELSLDGLVCAEAAAIPIGSLEAHVALDPEGRLARVRLLGDWIAAEPEVRALEDALVGEIPESARVRERCAEWLARPSSLVIGITDATTIAAAIVRSARAYSLASSS